MTIIALHFGAVFAIIIGLYIVEKIWLTIEKIWLTIRGDK